jgi:putative colanic acid biosynthesis UDP-glucose lipid carrier transferase
VLATPQPPQYLQGHPLTSTALLHAALAPTVAIAALSFCAIFFDQPLTGAYLILSIIVFSVTFPGRPVKNGSLGGLAISILSNWLLVAALLLLLGWTTQTLGAFDQRVIVAWILATPVALFAAQLLLPIALPRLMSAEGMQRVAVIVGGGQLGRQLAAGIQGSPSIGIRIAGYFEDRNLPRGQADKGTDILGPVDRLAAYVKSHPVDLIYITLPMASQPRILKLLDELRDTTVSIYFTPDIFLSDLIQARVDIVGGMPVVAVCETPFYGINGVLKRASDLILGSAILLLIAPLMLAIAIGIKLQSPGPAIFKQRRYGLDGREIIVYKFRSMTVAEDGDSIRQATVNDSRVTPFGAFLRRSSLDELPQFINVLQGKMSIVGPRPHAVAHNEMYRKLINGYMIRHKVRPGITGWAQVNGHRGETDTLEKMQKRIEYDLAYLRNWSLQWDLEIILKTVLVVCRKQNAY